MSQYSLVELLPEVVLLSTFPFIFYWFTRPPSAKGVTRGWVKVVITGVCVLVYLFVCALYFVIWFGSGMSGGGAGPYPLQRLLPYPQEVALSVLVLSAGAAGLARAQKGTLGLWVFAIGAGFTAFWAGLGWLPAPLDGRVVLVFAVSAGVGGLVTGFLLSRGWQPQKRAGTVLGWAVVGASAAAIGMLASAPGVQRAMRSYRADPIELTPFAIDPGVMLSLLGTAVVVWLALSTGAALATGYIKLGRRVPAQSGSE